MSLNSNNLDTKGQHKFSSRLGFILASVGSAVGMGNIWMFPYRLGQLGGAAFLVPYFLFIILFGYVGLSGEFALGRMSGTGPVGSYDYAMKSRGLKGGKFLGAIPLIGSFGIAIGYCVIVGWVLRSMVGFVSGSILETTPEDYFAQAAGTDFASIPWHAIVVIVTMIILMAGVIKGIEKLNKILMPVFFILFVIIAIRVIFLPGSIEGYRYLLIPDWSALLEPNTWVLAMGQAFFSLSITGSGMIIYGSYLKKDENIIKSSKMTALLDTCAALIAGFAIIPAVFAFNMDPNAGPPLMFHTLPKVFGQMPMGRVLAILFFLSVLFAGITSLMNMFEVCAEAFQKTFKLNRKVSIVAVSAIIFVIGLFIEAEANLGRWMDIVTIYIVPFGALLGAIMIYWVLKGNALEDEINSGRDKKIGSLYRFLGKYVYVVLTIVVFVLGIVYGGIG